MNKSFTLSSLQVIFRIFTFAGPDNAGLQGHPPWAGTGSCRIIAAIMKNEWMEIKALLREFIALFREFLGYLKEKREEVLPDLPEHMDTAQVYNYLKIDKATFYRSVFQQKLTPCTYAGSRPYYKKTDVLALMEEYGRHEKGMQTYGKKPRKKKINPGKGRKD